MPEDYLTEINYKNTERLKARATDEFLGIAKGILADDILDDKEIKFIQKWLIENKTIATGYPFNAIAEKINLINKEDFHVDPLIRNEIFEILQKFTGSSVFVEEEVVSLTAPLPLTLPCPEIIFPNKTFCFTGKFAFGTREDCFRETRNRGGKIFESARLDLDYLVIGTLVSKDWKHSSFGVKILKTVESNENNKSNIAIISEDSWVEAMTKANMLSDEDLEKEWDTAENNKDTNLTITSILEDMHWAEDINKVRGAEWEEEWYEVLAYCFEEKILPVHDKYLRNLFGGDLQCLFNFSMFHSRFAKDCMVQYVPEDNYYRKRFDVLKVTGAVKTAESTKEILITLPMYTLRELAEVLNCKKERSKKKLCENLCEYTNEELEIVWTKTDMKKEDFFVLLPIDLNNVYKKNLR